MKKKNSTVQQKKVRFANKYFKDPKIKKVYLTFRKKLYSQMIKEGKSNLDHSALYLLLKRLKKY